MRRNPALLIVVLAIVSALVAYVAMRLVPAGWPSGAQLAGYLAFASLVGLPVTALFLRGRGGGSDERMFWLAFAPLGLFVMLLTYTVLRDLAWLAASIAGALPEDPHAKRLAWDISSGVVVALGVGTFLLGTLRAGAGPRIIQIDVPITGLAPELHGFTIAQISDVHIGRTLRKAFLADVVATVNGIGADLIAVTGDLVDGAVEELREHTQPLSDLKARHGVWFVPGNHDYYAGVLAWIEELERLGVNVLLNAHEVLDHEGGKLVIGGVTDHGMGAMVSGHASDPHKAMAGAPADATMKLLLAHQPASAEEAANAGFHLQLSGHTHGGQFFPGTFLAHLVFPFVAGLNKHGALWVYTNRGTGYVGPPLRTVRAEVTHLRLVRAD